MAPACIVCAAPADVYCHNDEANLCFACDRTVHSAHSLALSHRRTPIAELAAADDSLDQNIVVPQEMLHLNKTQGIDDIDLSFSDDAWFAVPDTACSTARGAVKSIKEKGFEIDDLFGFDAALDEEVAFGLDAQLSGFEDCLVPEAEPVLTLNCTKELKQECEAPLPAPVPVKEAAPEAAPAGAAAPPPAAAHAAPIAFTYAPEGVPSVDSYIPYSLLPIDSSSRNIALAERREKVQRFREKKKNRQFKKRIRYASRKRYAEVRPRIKGRFARKDEIAAAKAAGIPLEC